MNNKININPSSTKWLEKDDRVVADYFCDLGFRSLKQILDMRVFDLMNMQGLNAVRVEEVIICLYKWLNPNIMANTGMRVGEITGLRWCDVDMENGIINVNHTLVYYNHRDEKGCYFSIRSRWARTSSAIFSDWITPSALLRNGWRRVSSSWRIHGFSLKMQRPRCRSPFPRRKSLQRKPPA